MEIFSGILSCRLLVPEIDRTADAEIRDIEMKHAVCILAHNNFKVLSALLNQLDSLEFDVYLHINAKVKEYPQSELSAAMKYAKLTFVPRVPVGYCDYSMMKAVISLFKTAGTDYHDYYHLVSGADLMCCTRQDFLSFFEKNSGKEFVGFSAGFSEDRVKYRNYFTAYCRQKNGFLAKCFIKLRKSLIKIQKILNLSVKIPARYSIRKGCDWYSVTHSALLHLLAEEPEFQKYFYRSYCPTEFFAQTILWNSPFREKLYARETQDESIQCARIIDWNRGSPYVFTLEDKNFLINTPGVFARKFDENKDMKIVQLLRDFTIKGDMK